MAVLTRLKAFADRVVLDRRLAAGESPHGSPEIERRATVLGQWRVRHHLVGEIAFQAAFLAEAG